MENKKKSDLKSIKWNNSEPRDLSSSWMGFEIRVRAIKHGTVWECTIQKDGVQVHLSFHSSADSSKQSAARVARQLLSSQTSPMIEIESA